MKTIILLMDYKNQFDSKYDSTPYRGGMKIEILKKYFDKYGYRMNIKKISDLNFRESNIRDIPIIYPSLEDNKMLYKSYIEDVIFSLEMQGVEVIPKYKYLKAHDNKVFMEILRDLSSLPELKTIKSYHFGTLEEFENKKKSF
jgi:hypothetical protein